MQAAYVRPAGNVTTPRAGEAVIREVTFMPYDAQLADRVRRALSSREHVREVTMFGGLAFIIDDRMVVCVSGGGSGLLVRVSPERDAQLVTRPGAHRAEMGKDRSMGEGWISVDDGALRSDDALQYWLDVSLDFHACGSGQRARKGARKQS